MFVMGIEDGIFPHVRSLGDPDELEEERRLAYVGITRAEERLYLTHAWSRMLFGSTQYNPPSRFLDEIPDELMVEAEGRSIQAPKAVVRVVLARGRATAGVGIPIVTGSVVDAAVRGRAALRADGRRSAAEDR